jgi:hypothetical protein
VCWRLSVSSTPFYPRVVVRQGVWLFAVIPRLCGQDLLSFFDLLLLLLTQLETMTSWYSSDIFVDDSYVSQLYLILIEPPFFLYSSTGDYPHMKCCSNRPTRFLYTFYPSQFHLSFLTGSIHTLSVCCCYMLNLNNSTSSAISQVCVINSLPLLMFRLIQDMLP